MQLSSLRSSAPRCHSELGRNHYRISREYSEETITVITMETMLSINLKSSLNQSTCNDLYCENSLTALLSQCHRPEGIQSREPSCQSKDIGMSCLS